MEVYRTVNNQVSKYVHDDGSETAIKSTPIGEDGYGNVKNKYNIFISHSVGCPIGCKFCYLTVKRCPYYKLTSSNIVANVIKALTSEIKANPILKHMYTKLSWMGMGDGYLDTKIIYEATVGIVDKIIELELSLGVDGVDISTTLPVVPKDDIICNLLDYLWAVPLNPRRDYLIDSTKKPLRVFYSLHSAIEDTRRSLIPMSHSLVAAVDYLKFLEDKGVPVILHHMLFDSINDSNEEIYKLVSLLCTFYNIELRLLRFNKCSGTSYKESERFDEIVRTIYSNHTNIKVQASPGDEVSAACGQFLLSKILN